MKMQQGHPSKRNPGVGPGDDVPFRATVKSTIRASGSLIPTTAPFRYPSPHTALLQPNTWK
ncbi:hypothetical protein [Chitinophaga sp.]|uniref:hypothetical protein n=1 Tax=Chitinophaga sp. TaxID=1869181 RepID=UPI002F94A5D0